MIIKQNLTDSKESFQIWNPLEKKNILYLEKVNIYINIYKFILQ